MKTKEELEELKQECLSLKNKLKELTDDELKLVTGGRTIDFGMAIDASFMFTGVKPVDTQYWFTGTKEKVE